ncbi:hypothetical protein [Gluconacetobacter liquefaciens]|uniref:Uncharacterized protein n=1 Tax=Gluconacetobacter liquefaciens TaxID=89584 RepID=A0A370G5M3_GLULI|nr:hypothetical protein [Gluconacetobacter liquefaciens]MBB2186464.1 hypothetical protein [Gluconacetobacter liquefaciens]RDI38129.1 hypothetical protein C7453_10466 [Gluconacetobacter liquefaciens]
MILLIGPDGKIFYPGTQEFFQYIGYFGQDIDLISYAIKNLGFAAVATFPSYTRIRFQPALFPAACLQTVLEIILYDGKLRFVLERVGTSFSPLEVIRNINDTVARLVSLQAATSDKEELPGSPSIIGLSLDRLEDPKRASLRAAFEIWKQENRYVTTQNIASLAEDAAFGGGGVVWMPGRDRCLIEAWPQSYRSYGDVSCDNFLGRDVRDLPDRDYTIPTTRSYFAATHQQTARLELIEALMTRLDGSRFWCRYERLVLPWRTSASDTFVCSVPMVRLVRRC